jgi:type IV pilus assembly protein PilQ
MSVTSTLRRTIHVCALLLVVFCAALVPPTARGADATEPLVTLDAEDAYLPSVLKILAEKGNLNIITGPGVTGGRISIHMKDVPIEQAVNLVVRAAGLAYERIGHSILVADPKTLKEETGLSSYVVDLQYADAADVKDALANLSAKISVDTGGNRLIVVTSPRVIAEIQEIISVMDVPAKQVMLEARIVEVSTNDLKDLGIDWDKLNQQTFIISQGAPPPSTADQLPSTQPFVTGTAAHTSINQTSVQAKAFEVTLDLLIREGNARVLAQPKIATLNGRTASMLIGSRIPYVISSTVFAGGGAAPTQRIEKEEVGIKLDITPLINADGYITTTIRPEVSTVTGFTGENSDLPIVATRQASTTVRLKDGNSVIIGGLLSEDKSTTVTKLPILGQIPLIGYLFQHQNIQTRKTDLVIEVTPRILEEQP